MAEAAGSPPEAPAAPAADAAATPEDASRHVVPLAEDAAASASREAQAVAAAADASAAAESAVDQVALASMSPRTREQYATYSKDLLSGRRMTRSVSMGKQLEFGLQSIQNLRPEMEDAHRVVLSSDASTSMGSFSYFGVFDGHGGSRAAAFAGERLSALLAEEREGLDADPVNVLQRAFRRTEEEWLAIARRDELYDGTTAAVVLLDRSRCRCIVGNVGDSEVILGTKEEAGAISFRALTEVHQMRRNEHEAERVRACGGRIHHGRLGHPKFNAAYFSLGVSRAIGDLFFKDLKYVGEDIQSGLSAEPFLQQIELEAEGNKEQFLIISCDGLWDTVNYQDATNFVFEMMEKGQDAQSITEKLVEMAQNAGSCDNITAMVVFL